MSDELQLDDEDRQLDDDGLVALAEMLATPPPRALRTRLLREVRRGAGARLAEQRLRRWRVASGFGLAAVAASAMLAVFTGWDRGDSDQTAAALRLLEEDRQELLVRLERQESEFALLEDALTVQSEVVRILASPRLMTASLSPGEGGPEGNARVLLDPASGAVAVIGSGLPPPRAGNVYEVWAIRNDGEHEPAGTLARAGGRAFAVRLRRVEEPREVERFAISIEPEGGAVRPTGPIILTGTIER